MRIAASGSSEFSITISFSGILIVGVMVISWACSTVSVIDAFISSLVLSASLFASVAVTVTVPYSVKSTSPVAELTVAALPSVTAYVTLPIFPLYVSVNSAPSVSSLFVVTLSVVMTIKLFKLISGKSFA